MNDDPLDTGSSALLNKLDYLSILVLVVSIPIGLAVIALLLDVVL